MYALPNWVQIVLNIQQLLNTTEKNIVIQWWWADRLFPDRNGRIWSDLHSSIKRSSAIQISAFFPQFTLFELWVKCPWNQDTLTTSALHFTFSSSILRASFLNEGGTALQWTFRERRGGRWKQGNREGGVRIQILLVNLSFSTAAFISFW